VAHKQSITLTPRDYNPDFEAFLTTRRTGVTLYEMFTFVHEVIDQYGTIVKSDEVAQMEVENASVEAQTMSFDVDCQKLARDVSNYANYKLAQARGAHTIHLRKVLILHYI
jgi:hypothetical protein